MICGKTGKVKHRTREGAMIARKRQGVILADYREALHAIATHGYSHKDCLSIARRALATKEQGR